MNSFFASVEQSCNPNLRGKPIFVCGEGRTVVATASYEARAFGIKTGMTKYQALSLCPSAIPVIGDYEKYEDASARIWEILKTYTDRVEMFSIDEAFMDITESLSVFQNEVELAKDIKKKIKAELGISCSIGIAPNKLLAKLASDMQKPDGLVVINKEDIPGLFANLPVEKFCGIGRKTQNKLAMIGIKTAHELGEADEGLLCNYFGFMGHFLKRMGLGMDNSEVGYYYETEAAKSVGHSYTMPKDTFDERVLKSYLLWLSEKVGRRLRQGGYKGKVVHFYMRYADFSSVSKQKALSSPIDRGYDIYNAALNIMQTFKPLKQRVRLLGVSVSGLTQKDSQLCFLEDENKQNSRTAVIDEIKDIYGENAIKPLSLNQK